MDQKDPGVQPRDIGRGEKLVLDRDQQQPPDVGCSVSLGITRFVCRKANTFRVFENETRLLIRAVRGWSWTQTLTPQAHRTLPLAPVALAGTLCSGQPWHGFPQRSFFLWFRAQKSLNKVRNEEKNMFLISCGIPY